MKKIVTNLFLLATLFLASTNLSAQTYNGGTWYSLYETGERTLNTIDSETLNAFTPVGTNLTFDAKKQTAGANSLRIAPIVNGSQQSNIFENGLSTSYKSYSATVSNSNSNQIKFYTSTGATLKKYFKNVKLPLAKHIYIADGGYGKEEESKSFGNVTIGNVSAAQTVKLRSFLTAGNITITSNNAAFRVGSSSNQGAHVFNVGANACASTNGASGTPASGGTLGDINLYDINIYFVPTSAGEHSGTITISDGTSSATISVSGVGVKKTQTIAWTEVLSSSDIALPMGKTITPPANAQTGITYSVADPAIISINENTLTALKAGTTTITATATENEEWLSATSTITVKVTEKKVQYIHWNDNLTRLKVGGEPVLLTATAWVLIDPKTETQEENSERTPLITYASANNNIVSVSGNVLTIVGEGETILTATLPGDDVYEGVVVSTPVHVRAVSTSVCEAYVLDDSKTRTLNTIDSEEYTINGPADKLTFTANRERLAGFSDGNLKVDQYYNGGWHNIFDQKVSLNDYTQYASIQLNRNATKLKFYTETGATGYKNIKDVAVTMATYLETTTPEIVVERSIIGSIIDETIRIQYSNLPDDVPVVNNSDKVTVRESGLGNVCGEYGEKELHLTIRPTEIGVIEDVITIHDEATGKKLEIPVTVHTQRSNQSIVWNQDISNIKTTDLITLNATANTTIQYISSHPTIASVEGNVLKIHQSGSIILTAVAVESNQYNQASAEKMINISLATPNITTLPIVDAVTYGSTFESAEFKGGIVDVEGQWQWNDARYQQVLNAGTYTLAIQFKPANTAYYTTLDATITVSVNKAAARVLSEPIAIANLKNNGNAQILVVAGDAEGGEMQYSLDGIHYSAVLPTAIEYGSYTVYYKVVADNNHTDVAPATLTVVIKQDIAYTPLLLKDNANNSSLLSTFLNQTGSVLIDRSLSAGMYNTLCLPFNVDDFTGTPLENATVWQYNGATVTAAGDNKELFLNFEEVHAIEAGKPYLVEPFSNIASPMEFTNVTITAFEGADVKFDNITMHGILQPIELKANDKSILFLVANNNLAWANVTANMNGMRAYFKVNDPTLLSSRTHAFINRVPSTTTNINNIVFPQVQTKKVVYNNTIYIIRGEDIYTIHGQKVNMLNN